MGAWSGKMAKKRGIKRLALESERGYHIELHNPSAMPKAPMMVAAGKFVVTPMEGRIRCAGVVEFASTEAAAQDASVQSDLLCAAPAASAVRPPRARGPADHCTARSAV